MKPAKKLHRKVRIPSGFVISKPRVPPKINTTHWPPILVRMEPPRLPAELTDRIIDFCHNDKKALSNCALTHSSWLAASRFHLFYTITMTGVHEWTDQRATLLKYICKRSSITSHGRSPILPYIRTVKIESFNSSDGATGLKNGILFTHAVRHSCCLEHLPIPSVHVSLGRFYQLLGDPSYDLRSFSLVSDIVTHIRLSNVTFAHSNGIWPFLSSFSRLQYMELKGIGFRTSTESSFPSDRIFDGVPLSTMRLTTASMGFVIRSLIRVVGSLSHLDDFGIAYQDIRQGELPQLADAVQGRVKLLRFSAGCYPGGERDREWRPSTFDISERVSFT